MGCYCLHPDRVKMGQRSRWTSVIYPWKSQNGKGFKMGCCCLLPDRVKLTVNSKKETNSWVKMGQESKWAKGQDGLLLFTPWKSQDGLLLFTPWQSQTDSEQQEKQTAGSKWAKGQDGPRLKMGLCCLPPEKGKMIQVSRWAGVIYPLKESN